MAIFKTQGVVLQVGKYSESSLYYKVFFREYGILTVTKKRKIREKPIDMGYLINCEVITSSKSSVHTIGNIKVIAFFETSKISYTQIESFLKLLYYIKKNIPEGSPHYEIFDILYIYIPRLHLGNIQENLLTHLKIISCLGELSDTHSDNTSSKILRFINFSKYNDILRLGKIPQENINHLEEML